MVAAALEWKNELTNNRLTITNVYRMHDINSGLLQQAKTLIRLVNVAKRIIGHTWNKTAGYLPGRKNIGAFQL